MWPGDPAAVLQAAAGGGTAADAVAGGVTATGGMAAAGYVAADGPGQPVDRSRDEVRMTGDLDAVQALAGMTGAGVGARLGGHWDGYLASAMPGTAEGGEPPGAVHQTTEPWWGPPAEPDGDLSILDRPEPAAGAGSDDTSISAGARRTG